MTNFLCNNDLPDDVVFKDSIAIDTEAMGLKNHRDRLCVVQISAGDGDAYIVQINKDNYDCPNLKSVLIDKNILKIFHYARFDVALIKHYLKIDVNPLYCTKIASKLARTYTDQHGLKYLCEELLGKKISKYQQSSDWGNANLTKEQINYAASDVLYLHQIKEILDNMLLREYRMDIAQNCFNFLHTRCELDLLGWEDEDIFAHR